MNSPELPGDGESLPTIRIAAALILNERGEVLLVRKRGTQAFMQPGGKLEPGESATAALERELHEELGCRVRQTRSLGVFSAAAANEPGHRVEATLFAVEVSGEVTPGREIAEAIWVDPQRHGHLLLAPLTQQHVLPLAAAGNQAQPRR